MELFKPPVINDLQHSFHMYHLVFQAKQISYRYSLAIVRLLDNSDWYITLVK